MQSLRTHLFSFVTNFTTICICLIKGTRIIQRSQVSPRKLTDFPEKTVSPLLFCVSWSAPESFFLILIVGSAYESSIFPGFSVSFSFFKSMHCFTPSFFHFHSQNLSSSQFLPLFHPILSLRCTSQRTPLFVRWQKPPSLLNKWLFWRSELWACKWLFWFWVHGTTRFQLDLLLHFLRRLHCVLSVMPRVVPLASCQWIDLAVEQSGWGRAGSWRWIRGWSERPFCLSGEGHRDEPSWNSRTQQPTWQRPCELLWCFYSNLLGCIISTFTSNNVTKCFKVNKAHISIFFLRSRMISTMGSSEPFSSVASLCRWRCLVKQRGGVFFSGSVVKSWLTTCCGSLPWAFEPNRHERCSQWSESCAKCTSSSARSGGTVSAIFRLNSGNMTGRNSNQIELAYFFQLQSFAANRSRCSFLKKMLYEKKLIGTKVRCNLHLVTRIRCKKNYAVIFRVLIFLRKKISTFVKNHWEIVFLVENSWCLVPKCSKFWDS